MFQNSRILMLVTLGLIVKSQGQDFNMSLDEMVDAVSQFTEDCDPVPEREHIIELIQIKEDSQRETKCLRHCLLKRFDMFEDDDGTQIKQQQVVDLLGIIFPNEKDKTSKMVETCATKSAGIMDYCEYAHAFVMCAYILMKEQGYQIPTFH